MNIRFLEAAEYELGLAVDYYNQKKQGIGTEFLEEIKNTIKRIANFPEAWHLLSKRTRRCQTRRFLYGVIYQIRTDKNRA